MKPGILSFAFAALAITAVSSANAQVSVQVGVAPFVYGGYAPPVVYQPYPYPYYAAPPVVYVGGGVWAGDRWGRGRGRGGYARHR
jgi:hypothetical protein